MAKKRNERAPARVRKLKMSSMYGKFGDPGPIAAEYVVRKGDSWLSIARSFRVDVRELVEANGWRWQEGRPGSPTWGRNIRIPGAPTADGGGTSGHRASDCETKILQMLEKGDVSGARAFAEAVLRPSASGQRPADERAPCQTCESVGRERCAEHNTNAVYGSMNRASDLEMKILQMIEAGNVSGARALAEEIPNLSEKLRAVLRPPTARAVLRSGASSSPSRITYPGFDGRPSDRPGAPGHVWGEAVSALSRELELVAREIALRPGPAAFRDLAGRLDTAAKRARALALGSGRA